MEGPQPVRVVTGATAGIGRAIANRLAAPGGTPLLLDEEYESASGQFFHRGRAIDPPPYTREPAVQRRIWEVSEQLTGLA